MMMPLSRSYREISARLIRDASLRRDSTSPAQHATLEMSSPLASLIKKERGADDDSMNKITYAD